MMQARTGLIRALHDQSLALDGILVIPIFSPCFSSLISAMTRAAGLFPFWPPVWHLAAYW